MNTLTWVIIGAAVLFFVLGFLLSKRHGNEESQEPEDVNVNMMQNVENLRVTAYKVVVPLRIQACERLLLYLERIQFPILVKRVFLPTFSRDEFQFALLQNVQDEFEHNLAQRLYVTEDTWNLVILAKNEVLENINNVFTNNSDADVTAIATILGSLQNPACEKAILSIKGEFDCFLVQ